MKDKYNFVDDVVKNSRIKDEDLANILFQDWFNDIFKTTLYHKPSYWHTGNIEDVAYELYYGNETIEYTLNDIPILLEGFMSTDNGRVLRIVYKDDNFELKLFSNGNKIVFINNDLIAE